MCDDFEQRRLRVRQRRVEGLVLGPQHDMPTVLQQTTSFQSIRAFRLLLSRDSAIVMAAIQILVCFLLSIHPLDSDSAITAMIDLLVHSSNSQPSMNWLAHFLGQMSVLFSNPQFTGQYSYVGLPLFYPPSYSRDGPRPSDAVYKSILDCEARTQGLLIKFEDVINTIIEFDYISTSRSARVSRS
jgi:hypothetical protein